jgi:hypothetical protein
MFCELQRKEGVVPEPAEWMEPMQMIAAALGVEARQLVVGKPEILTDDERAQHLGVAVAQLQTPFELTPAVLKKTMRSSCSGRPKWLPAQWYRGRRTR